MKIVEQAETRLMDMMGSVEKDPVSWEGWKCLHLRGPKPLHKEEYEQLKLHVITITHAHLDAEEITVFFCNYGDIYLFCKNVPSDTLYEIGKHLTDMLLAENNVIFTLSLYDLFIEGFKCVEQFYRRIKCVMLDYEIEQSENTGAERHNMVIRTLKRWRRNRAGQANVLLVEDDTVTQRIVRNLLHQECDINIVGSLLEARKHYYESAPDVVFLDINLPDGDGRELLEEIMAHNPNAYVVMFSGEDKMDNISKTLDNGAQGFVAKPFNKQKLMHYIQHCPSVQ